MKSQAAASERPTNLQPESTTQVFKVLLFVLTAIVCALVGFNAEAHHQRGGSLQWWVPDAQNNPLHVKFKLRYAFRENLAQPMNIEFGDSTFDSATGTLVGTGTDAAGGAYEVYEFEYEHTYPGIGHFEAKMTSCCRITALENAPSESITLYSEVNIIDGKQAGTVIYAPPIVSAQTGTVFTYEIPIADPDGDDVTCRESTFREMGLSDSTKLPETAAGNRPSFSMVNGICVMTWDLAGEPVGNLYAVQMMAIATRGIQQSRTAVDFVVETVDAAPPTCATSGRFSLEPGKTFSHTVTGMGGTDLRVDGIALPTGATLAPAGGTSQPSPVDVQFEWTPTSQDAGQAYVAAIGFTDTGNRTGNCVLILDVWDCPNRGMACTSGDGACERAGTTVCTGPQIAACDAVPGTPAATDVCGDGIDNDCDKEVDEGEPEVCDGKDNNCDGTIDEGDYSGGVECDSGLMGECFLGKDQCVNGAIECVAYVQPGSKAELCDNVDNDCDGDVDEDFNIGDPCDVGVGVCMASGELVCESDTKASCDASPGMAGTEVCGDGLDNNCNGMVDEACDRDGDGVLDAIETAIGSDPDDADSDDDGVLDGDEGTVEEGGERCVDSADCFEDTDGDGALDVNDPDADDDGVLDGTEVGTKCDNTDSDPAVCVPDADSDSTTDPRASDTDGGGKSDGDEDANRNGAVDEGETDPTDASDDVPMAMDVVETDVMEPEPDVSEPDVSEPDVEVSEPDMGKPDVSTPDAMVMETKPDAGPPAMDPLPMESAPDDCGCTVRAEPADRSNSSRWIGLLLIGVGLISLRRLRHVR